MCELKRVVNVERPWETLGDVGRKQETAKVNVAKCAESVYTRAGDANGDIL